MKATSTARPESPLELALWMLDHGYLSIDAEGQRRTQSVMAHRVIWTHLNGPIPDGLQVNHRNLQKTDNRPENLELVTGAGNIQHSYANDRTRPWSEASEWRPGRPRLSESDHEEIRDARASGLTLREVADRFGISTSHVSRICGGKPAAKGGVG